MFKNKKETKKIYIRVKNMKLKQKHLFFKKNLINLMFLILILCMYHHSLTLNNFWFVSGFIFIDNLKL